MANRLTDLELDEISVVDNPANPFARVLYTKRLDGDTSRVVPLTPRGTGEGSVSGPSVGERTSLAQRMIDYLGVGAMFRKAGATNTTREGGPPDPRGAEPGGEIQSMQKQDEPKGVAGEGTGGEARKLIRSLRDKGMTFEDISDALGAMGEEASRSPGILSAILNSEIKNPPEPLLGFLRRIKPPKDDKGASVGKLEARVAELEKKNAELEAAAKAQDKFQEFRSKLSPSLQKAFDDMSNGEREQFMASHKIGKGNDPVAKALESLEKRHEEVQKQLDGMKRREAIQKTRDELIKDLGGQVEDVDKLATAVVKLRAVDEDAAGELLRQYKATAAQAKAGGLFRVIGKDRGVDASDPEVMLQKHADEIRKAAPDLTREQAYSRAMQEHRDLYDQYRRQHEKEA
ncbi:MAG: hypothetical protein ACE5FA_11550 [Dehalococcoidia bacterium]